uniref:Putative tick transposon n=1 Tax=Rhipicephalus pulchellus TaxID=72859 RepID=L7LYN9_RHIPC
MGVQGLLLAYIAAFLGGRTMRVRVGGALSDPRPVSVGVPQGSVLSPFLFNLALADIGDYIPRALPCDVRVAIYADDIAVFAARRSDAEPHSRTSVQTVLNSIDAYITGKGMQLSPAKTEALMVHRSSVARIHTPRFTLQGITIPWSLQVTYLGVLIDHRLRWTPAVKAQCRNARRVASAARALLARGNGCSPTLALRLFNGMATARILYGLPLASLPRSNWEKLDAVHRTAIRQFLSLPRSTPIGPTLAEAGDMPLSLRADVRALNHIERMQRSRHGQRLIFRLHSLTSSRMGQCAAAFSALVPSTPDVNIHSAPPSRHRPLTICAHIPGVRSKRSTPVCALRQETAATLDDRLSGRLHLFTDGSVLRDGSAAAACVIPSLELHNQCRLVCEASSTIAELAALDLAADALLQLQVSSAAVITDSRPALQLLARGYRGPPLAKSIVRRLEAVQDLGCDLILQWVPAHIGIPGNEAADALAKAAHAAETPTTTAISCFDVARSRIARSVASRHPDARVAASEPPRPLPRTGLARRARAFLLRLRMGVPRTAERLHRLTGEGDPSCPHCPEPETLAHILLSCAAYSEERRALVQAYKQHGLGTTTTDQLLFPRAHASVAKRVFGALVDFFVTSALYERL